MVLARLGIASPDVIATLRPHAAGLWPAMALGRLGDIDWLLTQPLATAVRGLTAPYKAITQGPRLVALDYTTLERLLTELPAAVALAEKELSPGHSPVRAQRGDEEVLLRGLSSSHRVVRWHAVSLCGLRDLDPRVLPAVADRLDDEDATTRRLAVLTLRRWKDAAAPFASRIAALANDPDALVRRTVVS
jgi:HEAT repeat protein